MAEPPAAPSQEPDLSFLAAEALSSTELALESVQQAIGDGAESELWERAQRGLERAYDALHAIRRSQ